VSASSTSFAQCQWQSVGCQTDSPMLNETATQCDVETFAQGIQEVILLILCVGEWDPGFSRVLAALAAFQASTDCRMGLVPMVSMQNLRLHPNVVDL